MAICLPRYLSSFCLSKITKLIHKKLSPLFGLLIDPRMQQINIICQLDRFEKANSCVNKRNFFRFAHVFLNLLCCKKASRIQVKFYLQIEESEPVKISSAVDIEKTDYSAYAQLSEDDLDTSNINYTSCNDEINAEEV